MATAELLPDSVMPRDAIRGIIFVVIPYFSVCIPYCMCKVLLN